MNMSTALWYDGRNDIYMNNRTNAYNHRYIITLNKCRQYRSNKTLLKIPYFTFTSSN